MPNPEAPKTAPATGQTVTATAQPNWLSGAGGVLIGASVVLFLVLFAMSITDGRRGGQAEAAQATARAARTKADKAKKAREDAAEVLKAKSDLWQAATSAASAAAAAVAAKADDEKVVLEKDK